MSPGTHPPLALSEPEKQCFSNFPVHANHLRSCVQMWFQFRSSGVEPEMSIFNTFSGDGFASGLRITSHSLNSKIGTYPSVCKRKWGEKIFEVKPSRLCKIDL